MMKALNDERLILTPYLFRENIKNKEYIGNMLNVKHFFEYTEKVKDILSYFNDLRNVPEHMIKDSSLIEKLIEGKILFREHELKLPLPNIELEITNNCNSNCSICPRSKLLRKKGYMSEATFNNVINRIKETLVNEVEICGIGEPMLHPGIGGYIRTLKNIGIKRVKMVTNASLLSGKEAERLVQAGLDEIMISFHTIYPNKYSKMMKGLDYSKVLENIKHFINNYSDKVEIIITCVVSKENTEEMDAFRRFWMKLGVENLYFQNFQSRAGNLFKINEVSEKSKCPVFEQGLFITWKGEYLSCSNDFSGESRWANIENMSIKECLNNKLDRIRNGKLFNFCKYCDYDFHKNRYLETNFFKYVSYQETVRR